jgi:hypothetical protein
MSINNKSTKQIGKMFFATFAVINLIVNLVALNPSTAKRIVCKSTIFFELNSNVNQCRYGCGKKGGTETKSALKEKKQQTPNLTKTVCENTKKRY